MKFYFFKKNWQILTVLVIAAIMRFGGLSWALPYTPHPDEWNMANAISQLSLQNKLNPNFFAYGQLPLYLPYFSAIFYNLIPWIKIKTITVQEAIFFLRFWSALAGTATIYLVYLISRHLLPLKPPTTPKPLITNYLLLITPLLAAFTPGLIQISHFGTTESLLSFFFLLIIFLSLKILEQAKLKYFIFLGMIFGLAIGTKISALVFGFPILITFIILITIIKFKNPADFLKLLGKYFLTLTLALTLIFTSSPYLILAFKESRSTLLYETSVATGSPPVFYTRQFINTVPVLFQLQKIFPYTLGWPIFLLGMFGILFSIIELFKNKKKYSKHFTFYILHFTFWSYFLSQAFLFAKWTRFMSPIFAFFPIFAAFSLQKIISILRSKALITNCLLLITFLAILPGILFATIYFSPDIRFTASDWIYQNIPSGSRILYDTGNVVDVPIRPPNYKLLITNYSLVSFDFYHLDENSKLFRQLIKYLEGSDYIIVPSRRVFANHSRFPDKFPQAAKYYELLFSGKLGFVETAKFEPFYSKIFKDEKAEETFTVFDHPTIRIYKKISQLKDAEYERLFQ